MGHCHTPTGVAHFKGRKNQAHDGLWCYVSCQVAKRNPRIPVPIRCSGRKRR